MVRKTSFHFCVLSGDHIFVVYVCDAAIMVMDDATYDRSSGGLGPKYWQMLSIGPAVRYCGLPDINTDEPGLPVPPVT
jgi:hypothetical protein